MCNLAPRPRPLHAESSQLQHRLKEELREFLIYGCCEDPVCAHGEPKLEGRLVQRTALYFKSGSRRLVRRLSQLSNLDVLVTRRPNINIRRDMLVEA